MTQLIKTSKELKAIFDQCQTVAELNKANRQVRKNTNDAYLTADTIKFAYQGRKHQILMAK